MTATTPSTAGMTTAPATLKRSRYGHAPCRVFYGFPKRLGPGYRAALPQGRPLRNGGRAAGGYHHLYGRNQRLRGRCGRGRHHQRQQLSARVRLLHHPVGLGPYSRQQAGQSVGVHSPLHGGHGRGARLEVPAVRRHLIPAAGTRFLISNSMM